MNDTARAGRPHRPDHVRQAEHPERVEHAEERLRRLVGRLSIAEKVRLVVGEDLWSLPAMPHIGLRKIRLSDGPVGVRGSGDRGGATTSLLLPSPTAQAATWDPQTVRRVGYLLGAQARDKDVHVLLAPTINMHRTPYGGRHFECFSEDPLLTARIATAFIDGVQAAGVAATAKHFLGNETENDRMIYDSRIDERALREVYLAPFEAAVRDAGVWAVMSAYNSVNGHSMTENTRLQNDVLKNEWGFDGVVVSDWMAVRSTEQAALGGTDLAMPGPCHAWGAPLLDAVADGRVPESVLDDKVLRILRLADRVGALGSPRRPHVTTPSDAAAQIREITARTMVLLENRAGTLPLDPAQPRRVAAIGPNAARLFAQGGGSAHITPASVAAIPDGLRRALGQDTHITVHRGILTHEQLPALPADATADPATGEPGLRVEYRAADGTVLAGDRRPPATRLILWPDEMPAGTTTVTVRARVTPRTAGVHLLDLLGTGAFSLRVGAHLESIEPADDSGDIARAVTHPPRHRTRIPAHAGVPVDIELHHRIDGTRLFTAIGLGWDTEYLTADAELDAAVAAAAHADVAVVVVGTTEETEAEGFDRTTLSLPGRSDELVRRVAEANPTTIVVVNAGGPVAMPWRHDVAAVLWAWLPGQAAGDALADVLTGAVEPGGRLPTTFPAADEDVPIRATAPVDGAHHYTESTTIGYRRWALDATMPAYPFGYGLGYTTWTHDTLTVTGDATSGLTVTTTVTNTGTRHGRHVVQAYLEPADGHLHGHREPARLVGFTAVDTDADTTATAHIAISPQTLARYDEHTRTRNTPPGAYRLSVGRNAHDLPLTATIRL